MNSEQKALDELVGEAQTRTLYQTKKYINGNSLELALIKAANQSIPTGRAGEAPKIF